jgi:FKBP-type peptidyl-prolyl cis-trans isomerase (trigger factor)
MTEDNTQSTGTPTTTSTPPTSEVSPHTPTNTTEATVVAADANTAVTAADATTSQPAAPEAVVAATTAPLATATEQRRLAWKPYLWAAVAVLVMGVGLAFVLEQQGRINTSYFTPITKLLEGPAATVNGAPITRDDFDRNFEQVMLEVEAQGFTAELDPEMEATLKEQAIQSLVNAELLKQAAKEAGVTADSEALEARLAEIETGNGGAEQLAARMAEFGITMEQLRIDVENELIIQTHLNNELDLESVVVTDEEIAEVYNQVALENAGTEIPPLTEVTDLLRNQILSERQQQLVGEYIETLRQAAEIVINV